MIYWFSYRTSSTRIDKSL